MHLCYIDESGNTGNNLADEHQPYLVLTALLVPPEHVKAIENDIRALTYRYFAAESRNTDFELHGDAIYNARGHYFKKLALSRRIELLDDIVALVATHDAIQLGYVAIKKASYYGKPHIQQTAFHLLVERIEERLQGFLDSYCLLIADEQDEIEQRLIDDLDRFKQHGTDFGYKSVAVDRIIDSVHFVESKNNFLMQLTDVYCYLIRRGKEAGEKLRNAYLASDDRTLLFPQWLESAHRGQRYFYGTYRRLAGKRGYLFSKDFP